MKEEIQEAAESRFGTDMDSIRGSSVYDLNTDLKRGFIEGANWQAERMYSEEEVLNFTQIILSQYAVGNTNIEQLDLLKETLHIFKNK